VAPAGETPRVADSSVAGAYRIFHTRIPPAKQNRLPAPEQCEIPLSDSGIDTSEIDFACSVLALFLGRRCCIYRPPDTTLP